MSKEISDELTCGLSNFSYVSRCLLLSDDMDTYRLWNERCEEIIKLLYKEKRAVYKKLYLRDKRHKGEYNYYVSHPRPKRSPEELEIARKEYFANYYYQKIKGNRARGKIYKELSGGEE